MLPLGLVEVSRTGVVAISRTQRRWRCAMVVLCWASTSCYRHGTKGVDARDKPIHDKDDNHQSSKSPKRADPVFPISGQPLEKW